MKLATTTAALTLSPCAASVRQQLNTAWIAPASLTLLLGLPLAIQAAPFTPDFDLAGLDGNNGFIVNGANDRDRLGSSVSSAGDINGDGIDDLIIGAAYASPNGIDRAGTTVVVFGGPDVGDTGAVALGDLDGSNGFVINGTQRLDRAGLRVSDAGDINGDGLDDLLIGSIFADSGGENPSSQTYVIFGASDVGGNGTVELSDLNGDNGFAVNGADRLNLIDASVSAAGDINGDQIDDLIIGARNAAPDNRSYAGQSYVVFGADDLGETGSLELSSLDGSNGFTLNGINSYDYSGASVSNGGDINGDGMDDLIIGAGSASIDDFPFQGQSYVVFGGLGVGSSGTIELSTLNGSDGFLINGIRLGDNAGQAVSSAGDINGDQVDDLLIGGFNITANGLSSAGQSYVVFGGTDVGASGVIELSDLDGSNGFFINGEIAFANSGFSVSDAGDINADGVGDIIVGTYDPGGFTGDSNDLNPNNRIYVVFGGTDVGNTGAVELSALDGDNGFLLSLFNETPYRGTFVSDAGDVNDDGVDDLLIGLTRGPRNSLDAPGEGFVVFMPLSDNTEDATTFPVLQPGQTRHLSFDPSDDVDTVTFSLNAQTTVLVETANDGTALDYDTNLAIERIINGTPQTIATNDDIETGINLYSRITQTLPAGEYVVNVTPKAGATIPSFALSVEAMELCDITDPALKKTLGNGEFELLSLPCQPPAGSTINDLFNDDIVGEYFNPVTGTGSWVVFTWDPEDFSYINPGPNTILEPGQGFWISQAQANGQDAVLDLPAGSLRSRSTGAAASACVTNAGCLAIPLYAGEFPVNTNTQATVLTLPNLIGNPYDQPITTFDDLRVTTTIGECSIGSDGCSPEQSNEMADVFGNVAFTYNPKLRGGLGDYETITRSSTLSPWQGFWVFQLPAGVDNNPVVRFPDLRNF